MSRRILTFAEFFLCGEGGGWVGYRCALSAADYVCIWLLAIHPHCALGPAGDFCSHTPCPVHHLQTYWQQPAFNAPQNLRSRAILKRPWCKTDVTKHGQYELQVNYARLWRKKRVCFVDHNKRLIHYQQLVQQLNLTSCILGVKAWNFAPICRKIILIELDMEPLKIIYFCYI